MPSSKKYLDDIDIPLREALLAFFGGEDEELIYKLCFLGFQTTGYTTALGSLYTGYITPLPLTSEYEDWFAFYKSLIYPISRLTRESERDIKYYAYVKQSRYPFLGHNAPLDAVHWSTCASREYTAIKAYAPNPVQALYNHLYPWTKERYKRGAPVNVMNWQKGRESDELAVAQSHKFYLVAPLRSLIYNTGSILVPVWLLPRLIEQCLKDVTTADADFTSDKARIYWVREDDTFYFCSATKHCVKIKLGTIEEAREAAFLQKATIAYYANQFEDSRTLTTPKTEMAINLTDINLYITHIETVKYDTASKYCIPTYRVY